MTGHIVTQIVKTELVVGSERDISAVGVTAGLRVRLMLVYAIHRESVEHIERTHPLGITLGQVIVHRNHVYAVASQGVKEHRKGGHKGLTFTGGHLGNLAFMQNYAAKQLHIIVDHVPYGVITAGHPVLLPQGLVSVYYYKIMLCGQVAVKIGCGHLHLLILGKAACSLLYYCEYIGQNLIKNHLIAVKHLLLQLVNLVEKGLALLQFSLLYLSLKLFYAFFLRYDKIAHLLPDLLCSGAQLII